MAEIRKIVSHLHPLLIIYSRGPSPKSVSAYFWSRSKGHCGGAEICTISDNRSLHSRPADGDLILAYGVEGEGECYVLRNPKSVADRGRRRRVHFGAPENGSHALTVRNFNSSSGEFPIEIILSVTKFFSERLILCSSLQIL